MENYNLAKETNEAYQTREPLNLLIVDDDMESVQPLADTIRLRGHHVTIVDEASRCLTLCEQENYDMVFMDYHMPGLKGDEAIEFIKSGTLKSVVIVFTGDKSNDCVNIFKSFDVDVIMFKPADPELIHAIIFHLENRKQIDSQFAHKLCLQTDDIMFPHCENN